MAAFDFYTDAGLTNLVPSPLITTTSVNGAADMQIYCGGTSRTFKANSNPGVDPITISITGTSAQGATSVRLATTQAGLDTATGGASLDLGVEIVDSTSFWVRFTDLLGVVEATGYTGLSLHCVEVI